MSWRFYPCEGFPNQGILLPSNALSKPRVAEYLTPEQAKALQKRKAKA